MALSQNIVQKQTQKLVITQDLRQSIELLPLSNLELSDRIQNELVENPLLEEGGESDPYENAGDVIEQKARRELEKGNGEDTPTESWKETYSGLSDDSYYTSEAGAGEKSEKKHQFLQNGLTSFETLHDHLIWQLRMTEIDEKTLEAGELVISAIDSHGFLTTEPEELISGTDIPVEMINESLERVYALDPIGCGAKNIQETLFIQARLLHPDDHVALTILEKHFDDMERLDYKKIEKATSFSLTEIETALQFIRTLEPFPGTLYITREPDYILPDLSVMEVDSQLDILINDDWIPSIRVNEDYRNILKDGRAGNDVDREYLQTRLNSAQWLIKSIGQRRQTLFRVMKSILEFQKEFFYKGHGHLKPLTLKDVAEDLELHESTVSRITTNKYVQTRWGIFELKYFFTGALRSSGGGEGESAKNIKDRIRQIIQEEDPNHPLSDQEIVNIIQKEGVEIARRTVAKYRKLLEILPADRRKKLKGLKSGH